VVTIAMNIFRQYDENKSNTITIDEFEVHFKLFYEYSFQGLVAMVRNASQSVAKNKLDEIVSQPSHLKLSYVKLIPFVVDKLLHKEAFGVSTKDAS
jgi:hypothetical protein